MRVPASSPVLPGLVAVAVWLLVAVVPPDAAAQGPEGDAGPRPRIWIGGRAALEEETPAAGALVSLRLEETADVLARRLLEGGASPAPEVTVRADEWGGFRLSAPGPGPWTLRVELEGRLAMEHRILPVPDEQELAPVVLRRAELERLKLVDPGGRPAADSWVEVSSSSLDETDSAEAASAWRRAAWAGFLGEDGVLDLPRAEGEQLVLALGNAWGRERLALGPRREDALVVHEPWVEVALLEARVVDAAGGAIAEALVRVDGLPWTLTDESGVAVLPAPPDVAVEAIARDGRRGRLVTSTLDRSWFGDGDASGQPVLHPVEVELEPLAEIHVRLLSASRDPIGGAWLRADGAWQRSGPRGELSLGLTLGSARRVEVGAVGHRWAVYGLSASAGRPEGERSDSTEPTELTLEPTAIAEGFVVDAAGRAIAGAELVATATVRRAHAPARSWARSRADGSFRLRDLEPRIVHELSATHPELPSAEERFGAPGPREIRSDLRITLRAPRRVAGTVVRADDLSPVAGARVWIEGLEDRPAASRLVVTGADGKFAWDEIPDGVVFDVHAAAAGLAPGARYGVETPVDASGDVELGPLALETGEELEVIVRGANGILLEGATVAVDVGAPLHPPGTLPTRARRSSERWARRQTDARGEAGFDLLRDGARVDVYVAHPEHVSVEVEDVRIPRHVPLEVSLEPGSNVWGTVTDEHDQPLAGVFVAAFPLGPPLLTADDLVARTDTRGEYRIGGLPAGRHRLEARPYGRAEIEPVELLAVAGERYRVDFRVPPSARVEGVVRDAWGAPLADAKVVAAGQLASTDAEGRFLLDRVRLGEHRFEVRHRDRRTVTRRVVVEGDLWLDFELGGGAGIVGRVVDLDGRPLRGVGLRAFALGDAQSYGSASSADGGFAFTDLEPGRYRVRVSDFGFVQVEDPIEVTVDEEAVREITVRVVVGETTLTGRVVGLPAGLSGDQVIVEVRSGISNVFVGVEPDGSFERQGLTPGRWTVRAQARRTFSGRDPASGDSPMSYRGSAEVLVRPGDREVFVEVRLESDEPEGVRFSGRLTVDGAAPVGTYLLLNGQRGATVSFPVVNVLGEFEGEGVAVGTYDLIAAALDTTLTRIATLDLHEDLHRDLELFRAVAAGTIVDATSGLPIEGAEVFVLGDGASPVRAEEKTSVISGKDGRFQVRALVPVSARLWVRKAGYLASEVAIGPGAWSEVLAALSPGPAR